MTDSEFETLRKRAFDISYRMLGSVADAEDIAQESLLRFSRVEEELDEPAAWITTVSTRLSLDHLRLARVNRETYVGPWLPEPLIEESAPGPDARAELADSLSQAFLVLLERLTPTERAAFLLRDVFGYDYARIATILERSEVSTRQLVTRAKKRIESSRPRFDPDEALRDALLERFLAAAEEGDVEGLEEILAHDAVLYADGGGKAITVTEPVAGGAAIAEFLAHVASLRRPDVAFESERVRVNGQPGRILRGPGNTIGHVLSIDVVDGRIQAVRIMRNPDKLAHVAGSHDDPSLRVYTPDLPESDKRS